MFQVECENGKSLLLGVVLMWLCHWFVSTARRRERRSWPLSRLPIPGSIIFRISWRPSSLLPLESQKGSTWTNSLRYQVLRQRSKKLLCFTLNLPRDAEWFVYLINSVGLSARVLLFAI